MTPCIMPPWHFDNSGIELLGQLDFKSKQIRPVLIADPECILETLVDHQQGRLSLTFQQRISGNGRAHFDGLNVFRRDRLAITDFEQVANAFYSRIGVMVRVFREQLPGDQRPIGCARDNIGEGSAAVDPELPLSVFSFL